MLDEVAERHGQRARVPGPQSRFRDAFAPGGGEMDPPRPLEARLTGIELDESASLQGLDGLDGDGVAHAPAARDLCGCHSALVRERADGVIRHKRGWQMKARQRTRLSPAPRVVSHTNLDRLQ